MNEIVIGTLVTQYMPRMHIAGLRDSYIYKRHGHIFQDWAGQSLLKNMVDLTMAEFQSIVLQTFAIIGIGQETIQLKHHDIHLENVFVSRLKDTDRISNGSDLNATDIQAQSQDVWEYVLTKSDGTPISVKIKHCNLVARIGDFGLSSATNPDTKTRYERIDYELLDSEHEWGTWNGQLEQYTWYDVIVFLCSFFLRDEKKLCTAQMSSWVRRIYKLMFDNMPALECSMIGRPLRKTHGTLNMGDLFDLLLKTNVDESSSLMPSMPDGPSLRVYPKVT
jgi:hypothetical protein